LIRFALPLLSLFLAVAADARSSSAKRAFRSYNTCPGTGSTKGPCAGYVIDHIQALKHGGADSPDNMQWQTREEAKAKDLVEWTLFRRARRKSASHNSDISPCGS
jgi:hypothetical protein